MVPLKSEELHVVFLSTTWGQCCQRLTATGRAAAGQALVATSNHKDDTDLNKLKLGVFPACCIAYSCMTKYPCPQRTQPPAPLTHCCVIADISPQDKGLTTPNK